MKDKITRYCMIWYPGYEENSEESHIEHEEHSNGRWVLYRDHEKAVAQRDDRIAELERENTDLRASVTMLHDYRNDIADRYADASAALDMVNKQCSVEYEAFYRTRYQLTQALAEIDRLNARWERLTSDEAVEAALAVLDSPENNGRVRPLRKITHDTITAARDAARGGGMTVDLMVARYTIGNMDSDPHKAIHVEYAGKGRWAVRRNGLCLGIDGEWDDELMPSSRTEEWLSQFRFPKSYDAIDAALNAAKEEG